MRRRDLFKLAGATVLPTSFAIAQPAGPRTLRFVPQNNLTVLDPIFTTASGTTNHGWAVYDTLFGVNSHQEVRPQMADGFTESDDGRTYLIRLRDGLKFHNGEPVRAQDCAPSLARWAARTSLGQAIGKYIDAWGVQDDRTVKITLTQSLPIFIWALAKDSGIIPFMLPEHMARTDPFKQITETTGSGPYMFVKDEFVSGASVTYRRNTAYVPRQEPADWTSGGKVAHFDRIEWKVIPDAATAAAALQTGEVDWYEQVQADLVPLLRRNPALTIGSANPTGFMAYLRFNHLHPPFNNLAVRRAALMAVDQTDYMAAITGGDATAFRTCKAMLACGTIFGREIGASAMPGDLEKARAALKASGYNGERAVILNPTDFPTVGPLGDVTYDLLKRIGMNVEMAASDYGTVQHRRVSKEPVEKGGWSIFHFHAPSATSDTPTGAGAVRGQGPTGFYGWYSDDVIEQSSEDWLIAKTATQRDAAADAFQARAFANVPSIPLGQFQIRTAYRKNLAGVVEASGAFFWNVRRV